MLAAVAVRRHRTVACPLWSFNHRQRQQPQLKYPWSLTFQPVATQYIVVNIARDTCFSTLATLEFVESIFESFNSTRVEQPNPHTE